MARERRREIAETMRQRILRALETGALGDGDALPSTRELGAELGADPRVIASAYRTLQTEGLVEIRPRGGVFVATLPGTGATHHDPPESWLAEVVADAVIRGVPAASLTDWFAAATSTKRLRVVVLAGMIDQVAGIARELRADYGLDASGMLLELVERSERLPRGLERAHLLVTTPANEARVRRLAERLAKPVVVACVRPDLMKQEWLYLLRRVAYVVVADPRFVRVVRDFVQHAEGAHNVHVLVAGRDDLSRIPPDAPAYVTEAAREKVGRTRIPGRLLAPMRVLTEDCVRTIARFIVSANLAALHSPAS
jgi:DNA-binding transcriptional regulator YhcF (GntR family)